MSVSDLLMNQPPISVGSLAEYPYDEELRTRFTMRSRFGDPVLLYKVSAGKIWLPRGLCPIGPSTIDNRAYGHPVSFSPVLGPKNCEQERLLDETVSFLSDGQSGILQASTGKGKTACALLAAAKIGTTTLVVVPKFPLVQQWADEIGKFLGLSPSDVGVIQADRCDVEGKKIVIAMIHSLSKPGRYPPWVYKHFGLMIVDELHRAAADSLSELMSLVPARLRLGLTATPDRQDGKEVVIYSHVGPVRVKSDGITMVPKVLIAKSAWRCPRVFKNDEQGQRQLVYLPHGSGKVGHIVKRLVADGERNQLLADLIKSSYDKHRSTMFLTDSLEHIALVSAALCRLKVPAADIGRYVGGRKQSELEAAKAKPVIMATFGIAREGTDIPWLETLVLGTPKAEITQIAGRLMREYPGKKHIVIIDVADLDSPVFAQYYTKRLGYYDRIKANVIHLT